MNDSVVIAGNLKFLNLGEVFQILGGNGSTGLLHIKGSYTEEVGLIYFKNGSPIDAKCGSLEGIDAVYALFGWTEGEFEFSKEDVDNKDIVKKSRMEIILEGTKMLDDGIIEKVGAVSFEERSTKYSEKPKDKVPTIKGPLVDYMYVVDEEDFSDGDTIIQQGKHGNWNWVVLSGKVEIRKETPKGQVPVLRVGVGSFVGSIAGLLLQSNVRSATVVAIGDAQLGVLDSQRLAMEYTCLSSEFKEIILSLDKRIKQVTNKSVEVFSKKEGNIQQLLKDKDIFIKQGVNEERVYSIRQGNAYIVRKTDNGNLLLNNLEEGDFVGNLPFLNFGHEPHSATVYKTEDLTVNEMNIKDLQNEYDQLSVTFKNMIENSAIFLSATTKIICDYKKKYNLK